MSEREATGPAGHPERLYVLHSAHLGRRISHVAYEGVTGKAGQGGLQVAKPLFRKVPVCGVHNGDLFVQKAPAATLQTLAEALISITKSQSKIRVIGTRHGEKLYETLVTREEMADAQELGGYFRIPADNRDLNYDKYFNVGRAAASVCEDYNSHNTTRLDKDGMVKLLMKLELVRNAVK